MLKSLFILVVELVRAKSVDVTDTGVTKHFFYKLKIDLLFISFEHNIQRHVLGVDRAIFLVSLGLESRL